MTWYTLSNAACASTEVMMNELYDWVTGATAGFPGGSVFTAGVKDATPAGSLAIPGHNSLGRWAAPNSGTVSAARQRLYRIQRGGVDYWFMLDIAYVGGGVSLPNLGLYSWLTTDLGKTADQFAAMAVAAPGSSTTSPYASACYPAHGATAYHFFTNGEVIHVAFKRSHTSTSSWQHFSFGKLQKPAGATWVGGEYFSGCDAPDSSTATNWDYTVTSQGAISVDSHLHLSATNSSYTHQGAGSVSYFRRGHVRVVGAKSAVTPFTTCSYCTIGPNMQNSVTGGNQYAGVTHTVGGASVQLLGSNISATPNRSALGAGANTWNQRSAGMGVELFYYDGATTQTCQYLGNIPGIRFLRIDNIDEEAVTNQDWKVFPVSNRDTYNAVIGENGNMKTGFLGVAYKLP